jgi:hypothetical protein
LRNLAGGNTPLGLMGVKLDLRSPAVLLFKL